LAIRADKQIFVLAQPQQSDRANLRLARFCEEDGHVARSTGKFQASERYGAYMLGERVVGQSLDA